jgi:hypothetical protein
MASSYEARKELVYFCSSLSCVETVKVELEARASSGRSGAIGDITGHAIGYNTGSGACGLLNLLL